MAIGSVSNPFIGAHWVSLSSTLPEQVFLQKFDLEFYEPLKRIYGAMETADKWDNIMEEMSE